MTVFSAELDIPTQTIPRVLLSTSPLELTDQSTKEKKKARSIQTRIFAKYFSNMLTFCVLWIIFNAITFFRCLEVSCVREKTCY